MIHYNKHFLPLQPNYVSYYQTGKNINVSFSVRYNDIGEVDYVGSFHKMVNPDNDWYVNPDKPGNITKEEFEEALQKTIKFLSTKA